jgi:hypothetical protein
MITEGNKGKRQNKIDPAFPLLQLDRSYFLKNFFPYPASQIKPAPKSSMVVDLVLAANVNGHFPFQSEFQYIFCENFQNKSVNKK